MNKIRQRNKQVKFMMTEDEVKKLNENMAFAGVKNKGAYLRKMALNGHIINIDFEPLNRIAFLLANATNNINQIAKKANETNSIHKEDIQKLQAEVPMLWKQVAGAMRELRKL